jgi:uncharacterized protein YukE
MPEAFRVDPGALADAAHRMAEFGRHGERMLAEIDALVSDMHPTWTREGAAAHAEAHRHWARGEAMMRESLARLLSAAATTSDLNRGRQQIQPSPSR